MAQTWQQKKSERYLSSPIRLFGDQPCGIRLPCSHRLCGLRCIRPKIFLVYDVLLGNNECHHTRRAILSGIGHDDESAVWAFGDIAALSLGGEYSEVIPVEWI